MQNLEENLKKQVAALESQLDLLETEITGLDDVLKQCGFPEGIVTLKQTVKELISEIKLPGEGKEE